jgi:CDGSH-type Zn-finger protein
MQTRVTSEGKVVALCGCGRSPSGDCIGWHAMTNEQYQVKLVEYNDQQKQQLLKEANN